MRHRNGTPRRFRTIGGSLLALVSLLLSACAINQEQSSLAATVTVLVPQVATAADAAATAQAQAEAAANQAATAQTSADAAAAQVAIAQTSADAAAAQAATAQALAATAIARTFETSTATASESSLGAAVLPLRRGLSIVARQGTAYQAIAYPIDEVEIARTPDDLANDPSARRVELVLSEVTTGTFTLIYNAQTAQLAGVQPDHWSSFTVQAPIQADPQGRLIATSNLTITEEPIGRIMATGLLTQTLEDNTVLSVGEVVNSLLRENVDLENAYILLIDGQGSETRYVLVAFFDPGADAGGGLFNAWCQLCFQGICRIVCG